MSEVPQTASADEDAAGLGRRSQASVGRGAGWEEWVVALAIAGMVAAPYATLTLPYHSALKAQACLILAFALVPLVAGLLRRGWWRRILAAPRPILAGIVLIVSATLLGTAIGLLRANDHAFVAGQVLSMGLLPLGVVAGLALAGGNLWRGYVLGIVGSVAVASCVHLGYWVFGGGVDPAADARFFFSNKVSPASAALIAVNLALAAALWDRRWVRWASLPATVAMLLLILGSEIRSLWLVTALSVVGVVLASRGLRRLAVHRITRRIALAALVAAAVFVGLALLSRHSHENSPRSVFSRLANEASFLVIRVRTLTQLVGGVSQDPDNPLEYRGEETRFLLETFRAAPLPAKVFGHGLGFTFTSKNLGYDEADGFAPGHPTNYIHNYYVFLPVKLGLFGGVTVVLALALWTAWSLRAALACSHEPAKTFLLAATAAWIAGLVWSLACPELLDFRMAPLWGYLLAASVDATHRNR